MRPLSGGGASGPSGPLKEEGKQMNLKEFIALSKYGPRMIAAVASGDIARINQIEAEVNAIHAQIDARKQARHGK
jgi:hypothetical protein